MTEHGHNYDIDLPIKIVDLCESEVYTNEDGYAAFAVTGNIAIDCHRLELRPLGEHDLIFLAVFEAEIAITSAATVTREGVTERWHMYEVLTVAKPLNGATAALVRTALTVHYANVGSVC